MVAHLKDGALKAIAYFMTAVVIVGCQQTEVQEDPPVSEGSATARSSIKIGGDTILSIMRIGPKGVIMAFNPQKISGQEMEPTAAAVCEAQGDVLGDEFDVTDPVYADRWPAGTKWFVFHCD